MRDENDKGRPDYERGFNPKPDPYLEREPEGLTDLSDPNKPTLTLSGWLWGIVLFLVPTIVFWCLHRAGYWPNPCWYYGVWLVGGLVVTVFVGSILASAS